ncbi:MAG: hypothetical protein PHQ47_00370 [Candidatus Portnoybacteria bacterium]|nr:hypothetical protein [Candidatus Portnoybacteria bacterium]
MSSIQYIAKLLRAPEETLQKLFVKMEEITGKKGVADKIFEENKKIMAQKLVDLNIPEDKADAQFVEGELLKRTKEADAALFDFLGRPDFSKEDCCTGLIKLVKDIKAGEETGFFLKEEKMKSFLVLNPPKNILSALGYANVGDLIEKEDIYEIFAALRFLEDERWVNRIFFRPYKDLRADHFEKREIKIRVLPQKWGAIAEKFIGQKLHSLSHLKELGLIFIIPLKKEQFPGQSLEVFSLLLHYLHEIDFYSRLFKQISSEADFGGKLVDLLSGKIAGEIPSEKFFWRILVRYLAKKDESDPRLFEAHVNPETIHWLKAEKEMDMFTKKNPKLKLDFWQEADDFVGGIFPAGKKGEEIVSFDLIDNVISLTHGGIGKYLYHQQEALWNKIFIEYMGEEKLEELVIKNIDKGYIEL